MQVYASDFELARVIPIASKGEAHETLLLLFTWDSVPPACTCNNAKEKNAIYILSKAQVAVCQLKLMEPYTPMSSAAKKEIKVLKKGDSWKLMHSRVPKCLWDDCLELEPYIKSNTTHDMYNLDSEVSKTMMSGEASYISQLCLLECFEWVIFSDEASPFPDDMLKVGHYLGPSIDTVLAFPFYIR